MGVSENSGFSPQIIHGWIGFSITFTIHFGGNTPIFGNTHILHFFFGGKTQLPPNVTHLPSQVQWWEFFYLGPLGRWLPKPLHWSGGTRRGRGGGLYLLVGRCLFLLDPEFFPQMDYRMFLKIRGFQFLQRFESNLRSSVFWWWFLFSHWKLGKWFTVWRAYSWNGLVQPPTSYYVFQEDSEAGTDIIFLGSSPAVSFLTGRDIFLDY